MLRAQESVNTVENIEIFVIDDEPDVRNLFKRWMQQENYNVRTSSGIIETLAMMRYVNLSNKIIFVIDYCLPDGNGVELADALWRRGVYDGVYILTSAGCDPRMYEYIRTFEQQSKIRKDCNTIDEVILKGDLTGQDFKNIIKKYV